MSTTMLIEYECGHTYETRLALRDDQTIIGNVALGEQMIGMIDATHDAEHPECAG